MGILRRIALGVGVLATTLAVGIGTVAAGNFAEVTMVDAGGGPPAAGESRDLEFVLLQHGVAPVNAGDVNLIAVLPGTDETFSVPLRSLGQGRWAATVTFPAAGDWQIRVTHSVFATSAPTTVAVGPATSAAAGAGATAGSPITFLLMAGVAALAILALVIAGVRQAARPATRPARAG